MMKMIRITYVLVVLGTLVVQAFGFDLIPFRKGDLWGYADPFGSVVFPPEYKFAGVFRDGIARVQTKEGHGFIAMNGRAFFASDLESARDFSDGMAAVKIKGTGKWGFLNQAFSIAIPPAYQEVGDFSENVAPAKLNGKWGVIDKQGKVLVPFQYDEIKPCRENALAVCSTGKWGFIRPSGELLIDFLYQKACSFSEGAAAVSPDGESLFHKQSGDFIFSREDWSDLCRKANVWIWGEDIYCGSEEMKQKLINYGFIIYNS